MHLLGAVQAIISVEISKNFHMITSIYYAGLSISCSSGTRRESSGGVCGVATPSTRFNCNSRSV
jgi:hypothetical protein